VSVAFRRESDEEHLEPSFAIPIPPGRNLVTAAGREAIAARVAELEALPPPVDDEKARKALLRDVTYWRQRLATAEIMPVPSGETVEFGCRVRLRLKGKEREIVLVGSDEADPAQGKLAYTAPLARAVMGAAAGDLVDFNGEDAVIEVLAVEPA
jgi:transcription elongation GreA/GreB family factor